MNRQGASLLETLIALTLTLFMLTGVTIMLARVERLLRQQTLRLEQVEVLRVARDRVGRSFQTGGAMVGAPASDGLTIRAFRGSAEWCGDGWRETGVRAPDPGRDSVWWVAPTGALRIAALVDRQPGGCGGEGYRWDGTDSLASGASYVIAGGVVRYFEVGRLRIDDAVRYGRLGQSAQPLTPAALASGSGVELLGDGSIALKTRFQGGREVTRRWPKSPGGGLR